MSSEGRLSSCESEDEAQPQGEKRFITDYFSVALDSTIMSLENHFELLISFMNTCGRILCRFRFIYETFDGLT
jgi:hypothetical protein